MNENRRRKTILYIIGSLDVGGAERQLVEIASRLRRRGWDIAVYCLTHRGLQADAATCAGVAVVGPPWEGLRHRDWPLIDFLRLGLTLSRLLLLMLARRPTVVHCVLPGAYIFGAPLAILTRRPFRLMSRRSLNNYQKDWPLARWMEPKLHRRMSALVANSDRVRHQLIAQEGCAADHVHHIYNGVDTERFAPLSRERRAAIRQRLDVPVDAVVGVMIANLIPYKGHADLIDALARVADTLTGPWIVLCAGRDQGIQQSLEADVARHGLEDKIRFMGARDDVGDVLACADLGILCSHEEGFSNAILESMAASLPMIVTDVGGNGEAVVDGETGIVVPARDPSRLGAAIVELAGDPERRAAMGAAGRHRASTLFSLDACVDAHDALYRGLLDRLPAGTSIQTDSPR